jgi:hypothetical protein
MLVAVTAALAPYTRQQRIGSRQTDRFQGRTELPNKLRNLLIAVAAFVALGTVIEVEHADDGQRDD